MSWCFRQELFLPFFLGDQRLQRHAQRLRDSPGSLDARLLLVRLDAGNVGPGVLAAQANLGGQFLLGQLFLFPGLADVLAEGEGGCGDFGWRLGGLRGSGHLLEDSGN